jgi:hypothetical protein
MNNMRKLIVSLLLLLLFSFTQVFAGSSDTWKSCCSYGCNYQPSCSPITFSFGTYYCCSSGWSTSVCPECGGGGTTTTSSTTTTTPPTPTTSTTTTSSTTTTTLPTCSCSQCSFYSALNCNNACSDWQNCVKTTCSASGCTANSNCYKCEWKSCSGVSPKVYVLTPVVSSASYLKASVVFSCQEWNYTIKNLTLTLYVDSEEWAQCFLDKKGLITDFGWDGSQMDEGSSNCKQGCHSCGSNGKWDCDSMMNCKHKDYDLWVYSNSTTHFVNVTFTCRLPSLTPGTHTLTAAPTIYHSSIEMKPSKTTFFVVLTDGKAILQILKQPFKLLLRIAFPFLI